MTFKAPLLALVLTVSLGGCAAIPPRFDVPTDANGTPQTSSIIDKITCELTDLVRDDLPADQQYPLRPVILANDYQTVMLLSLDVTDSGTLEPSFNFPAMVPAFNFGFKLNQSREDNISVSPAFSMRELAYRWAHLPDEIKAEKLRSCDSSATNLAGNLGLRSKITAGLMTGDLQAASTATANSGQFSGTINFNVVKSLENVGPTWTLTNFKGPGNLASASDSNNDKLTFGFARGKHAGTDFDPRKSPFDSEAEVVTPKPKGAAAKPRPRVPEAVGRSGAPTPADDALNRQLTNDVTIQLNGIRGNLR